METPDWPQDEWAWAEKWAQCILNAVPLDEPPAPTLPAPAEDAMTALVREVLAEVIAPPPPPPEP